MIALRISALEAELMPMELGVAVLELLDAGNG